MNGNEHEISFPWVGGEELLLKLPAGWKVKSLLQPKRPRELPDFQEALEQALRNPIGCPPLSRFAKGGRSACVVIDDRTRPTPVKEILPAVMAELNDAGLRDEQITILIALGTHRPMTEQEIKERIGPDLAGRFRVVNHDFRDKKNNIFLGKTPTHRLPVTFNRLVVEADTVVLVGCIEAHEQAGFGGGYKNLMPGCSGPEPIYATHNARFQKPERISSSGMPRNRCRFRIAVDECGEMLGAKVFVVDVVLDPLRPVAVVAGDPLQAHEKGAEIYKNMAAVRLPEPADAVIANASPLDVDLRTSMKACFNASAALKPGGVFITVSIAKEGLGDLRLPKRLPSSAGKVIKRAPLGLLDLIAARVNPSPDQAAGTISLFKILRTAKAWLYLTPHTEGIDALRVMGIEFFTDPEELFARATKLLPEAEAAVLPEAGASFLAWD